MSTLTTELSRAGAPRSRTERFTDAVIAGYLHSLAVAARQPARPQLAVAGDADAPVSPAPDQSEDGSRWKSAARDRCAGLFNCLPAAAAA